MDKEAVLKDLFINDYILRILLKKGFHEQDGNLYWGYIEGISLEKAFGTEFQDYCLMIRKEVKEPEFISLQARLISDKGACHL